MFTEEFPFNQRIRQISISVDKVNLYLATSHVHEFIQDYHHLPLHQNSLVTECFDSAALVVSDLNLGTGINNINLGMTPEQFKVFLNVIKDGDLTRDQKNSLLNQYGAYWMEKFLMNFHYLAAPFKKLLQVIKNGDGASSLEMPMFTELCKQSNAQLMAEDRKEQLSSVYISVYNSWIHHEQAKALFCNFLDCCLLVMELDRKILLLEQTEDLNWHNLIKELDESVLWFDHITFPILSDLPPQLDEEIRALFSDVHEVFFDWLQQLVLRAKIKSIPDDITLQIFHADPPTYN
ncbi:MAG: hypothetical protein BGO90_01940 [Legionella sp. 40-6]|nr:hypothetical protein [Legionella sp.]OJY42258.1 MAG: hypothetical protein BGO90_01940 [Legionella sp. 40-6]